MGSLLWHPSRFEERERTRNTSTLLTWVRQVPAKASDTAVLVKHTGHVSIFPAGDKADVLASLGPGEVFFGTHQGVKFGETSKARCLKLVGLFFSHKSKRALSRDVFTCCRIEFSCLHLPTMSRSLLVSLKTCRGVSVCEYKCV